MLEVELSMMRGRLSTAEACMRRNGGRPAHPSDVQRASVRYTAASELRSATAARHGIPTLDALTMAAEGILWIPDTT
jgi:hypothetical protein